MEENVPVSPLYQQLPAWHGSTCRTRCEELFFDRTFPSDAVACLPNATRPPETSAFNLRMRHAGIDALPSFSGLSLDARGNGSTLAEAARQELRAGAGAESHDLGSVVQNDHAQTQGRH